MLHILCSFALAAAMGAMIPRIVTAQDRPWDARSPSGNDNANGPKSVPEFDATTVGAVAAVVAGGGVLIARRRKR